MVYTTVSNDLIWQVIRKSSSTRRVQRGINKAFSTERFNITKLNSPRYNGFLNKNLVDVSTAKSGSIVIAQKIKRNNRAPARAVNTVTVRPTRRAVQTATRIAGNAGKAVAHAAQLRTSQLLRSTKPVKPRGPTSAPAPKTE